MSITFAFRLALLLVSVAVAMGCGGYTVEDTPRQLTLEGTLDGGQVDEFACVWLIDATGRRFDVFYPTGWEPRSNPISLVDPTGKVAAKRGDRVVVWGPEGIGESGCSPNVFIADTVRVIPGIRHKPGAATLMGQSGFLNARTPSPDAA